MTDNLPAPITAHDEAGAEPIDDRPPVEQYVGQETATLQSESTPGGWLRSDTVWENVR